MSGFKATNSPENEELHLQTVYKPLGYYGWASKVGFSAKAHLTQTSELIPESNRLKLFAKRRHYWDLDRLYTNQLQVSKNRRTLFVIGLLVLIAAVVLTVVLYANPNTLLDNEKHLPQGTNQNECQRPYRADSPWNQKIPETATIHPDSQTFIQAFEGLFGSNPYSWTIPVYEIDSQTPSVNVYVENSYREVIADGSDPDNIIYYDPGSTIRFPIPDHARPSEREDGQLVVLNIETGDEWGFYQAVKTETGWQVRGAYHYNINWFGVPPEGFAGRGGGSPYLAGLVRPCEIERGYIDHALVLGYDYPCSQSNCEARGYPHFIFPAIKSDGIGTSSFDLPEGTRLQLDPHASEEEIEEWCGDDRYCRVIVRAMQEYGVYVMENSGHPKIYVEDDATAHWDIYLDEDTVSGIPYTAFQVLNW